MSRSDEKRLDDIVAVGNDVAAIVARGRAAFDEDIALRRAVERCLEILGEAAKSLEPEVNELWATAEVDVPQMREAVISWRARGGPR